MTRLSYSDLLRSVASDLYVSGLRGKAKRLRQIATQIESEKAKADRTRRPIGKKGFK